MSRLAVRFPGDSFVSRAEFDAFCRDGQARIDARFAHEQAVPAGEDAVRPGTCAPCLRVARFTTKVTRLPDAAARLDWREGQFCDCADRLGNRARAMLHFLEASAGLAPWSRVLAFGPPSPLDPRLSATRGTGGGFTRLARMILAVPGERASGGFRLDAPDAGFHIAVCWDHLTFVPPLDEALAQLRRVLMPGGQLVFTVPMRYRADGTVSRLAHVPRQGGRLPAEFRGEIHEIGWDILDRLRRAGFSRALVHHYWSDELGYLGPFNLLLSASA